MNIDWNLFTNWIIQASISFLFGGLGAFVAFRFSLNLEKKREERQQQKKVRNALTGGIVAPASIKAAVKLAGNKQWPDFGDKTDIGRAGAGYFSDETELDWDISADESPSALLWVKNGRRRGKTYVVKDGDKVGRSQGNIILDDPKVSNPHARFRLENDTFTLWDYGSKNGSYVNGEQIKSIDLKENDEIKFGDTIYVFKILTIVDGTATLQRGYLYILKKETLGEKHQIKDGSFIIETSQGISFTDTQPKKPLGKFSIKNNQFIVWDLGTTNSISVDGEQINISATINENGKIKINETTFVIKTSSEEAICPRHGPYNSHINSACPFCDLHKHN